MAELEKQFTDASGRPTGVCSVVTLKEKTEPQYVEDFAKGAAKVMGLTSARQAIVAGLELLSAAYEAEKKGAQLGVVDQKTGRPTHLFKIKP